MKTRMHAGRRIKSIASLASLSCLLASGLFVSAAPAAEATTYYSAPWQISCSWTQYPQLRVHVTKGPILIGWGPDKSTIGNASYGNYREFKYPGYYTLSSVNGSHSMWAQIWASTGTLSWDSGTGSRCVSYT